MALVICPECGNQVSDQAVACPKCGRPFETPTVVVPPPTPRPDPVIVTEAPREKSFPNWIFLPIIVILGVVTLFLFLMMSEDSENDNRAQVNVRLRENENVRTRTVANAEAQTGTTETVTSTTQTIQPPVTQIPDSTVSTAPQTAYPSTGTTTTTSNTTTTGSISQPSSGNLEIKATVVGRTGSSQPVKQERFYLLNKSLDEILSRANIEPEEGDLPSTCAAAVIDPARSQTRQKCLAAINPHIVYRLTTDSTGKGTFKDVKPDSYYVFGVTKVGTDSYALWNTTVTVNPGENLLNLNGSGSPFSSVGTSRSPVSY